jgi:hypothetical protein
MNKPTRQLFLYTATFSLVLTSLTPAAAERSFNPHAITQPEGTVSVTLDDGIYETEDSFIHIVEVSETWANGKEMWNTRTHCESLNEAPCNPAMTENSKRMVLAQINMPVCEATSQTFCLETVAIYPEGETAQSAQFIGYNSGSFVPQDASRNLPQGAPASLWQGTAEHTGGTNTYSIQARAEFKLDKGKFKLDWFKVNVFPYVEVSRPNHRGFYWDEEADGDKIARGGPGPGKAMSLPGKVGEIHNFDLDTRVQLKLRVPGELKGWLKGRATDPNFTSTRLGANSNLWTLDAKPVVVPKIRLFTTDDKRTKMMKDHPLWSDGRPESWTNLWTSAEGSGALDWVKDLRTVAEDKATGQAVVWQLGATSWGTGACDSKARGISGFVLTNSLAYEGRAPQYSRGFLNYQVAGMHYLPDGTEALGTYDLVMDSAVVRCLYGFTTAPVSGTITISGEGDRNIATTIVSEKSGWLKLSAQGFTFSNKTIRVKLTQPRRSTITCATTTKPVKVRKVTGVNPTCPPGFRKR